MDAKRFPIVNTTPFLWLVRSWMQAGAMCAGGFPLWLMGGADYYGDIDLYVTNWMTYYQIGKDLTHLGIPEPPTKESIHFRVLSESICLARPVSSQLTPEALMATTDLTPSACALRLNGLDLSVDHLYPSDVAARRIRILQRHDWTDYRVASYEAKGYHLAGEAEA